jgi:hypothetical protein
MMNDIYIFHIYILIIHYIMQLYISGCGSRVEPVSQTREIDEPSRARSATELQRAEPVRLVSSPTQYHTLERD